MTKRKDTLCMGNIGVIALENKTVYQKQLEAIRISLRREFGKKTNIYMKIKALKPITKKPIGVRMGKGKGLLSEYVYILQKDEIFIELRCNFTKSTLSKINTSLKKIGLKTKTILQCS